MTNILQVANECPAVVSISAWKDRHYLNLAGFSRRMAGDRNLKVWIKGNQLKIEGNKGFRSDALDASLVLLIAAVEAAGATRQGYSDTIEATYTL